MKKLAILALGVLSLVACTDQKVVNYNTARLDVIEDYLRNHKYVKPSENYNNNNSNVVLINIFFTSISSINNNSNA